MGRLDGKVAFITGAARGQGRSHAVRLAAEGSAIIAIDICEDIPAVRFPLATDADLKETARLVQEAGGDIVTLKADVRSSEQLEAAVATGLDHFGHIDTVLANAGVVAYRVFQEMTEEAWRATYDVNVTGVLRTVKAVAPSMIEHGAGGSIIITSSASHFRGGGLLTEYASSKSAVVGMKRAMALALGPHRIRVNCIMPSTVFTKIVDNEILAAATDLGVPYEQREAWLAAKIAANVPLHMLPEPWLDVTDVSNAVLFLASDESRSITSEDIRVDIGLVGK